MTEEKRYSDMTEHELRGEIARLKEKARKAEQLGMVNEFAVLERKAIMAAAYMLDPADFKKGEVYRIEGDPNVYFQIDYLKGYSPGATGWVEKNIRKRCRFPCCAR